MDFVERLVYLEGNETYTEDEVPQKFRMTGVRIDIACPICRQESTIETESPIRSDFQYTCPHCEEQYFIYPAVAPKGKSLAALSTEEKVETQLESVAKFHRIADRYPDESTALASAPETAVFGMAAVLIASFGLGAMAVESQALWESTGFTVGYFATVVALSLGASALVFGAAGSIYRGWLIYKSIDPSYSFRDFILHSGNYYHRNPFLRK